jgi:hypothetical protein
VSDILKKLPALVLKMLLLGCLLLVLAVPAPAQDAKDKAAPPKGTPPPRALRTMPPPQALPEYKSAEDGSMRMPAETLERKNVTGTAGGQEIRRKSEPGDN